LPSGNTVSFSHSKIALHRYALNVAFNLTNKSIYKFFPFPWTVSTVHVFIGTVYCAIAYALGAKKASFGRVSAASISI